MAPYPICFKQARKKRRISHFISQTLLPLKFSWYQSASDPEISFRLRQILQWPRITETLYHPKVFRVRIFPTLSTLEWWSNIHRSSPTIDSMVIITYNGRRLCGYSSKRNDAMNISREKLQNIHRITHMLGL